MRHLSHCRLIILHSSLLLTGCSDEPSRPQNSSSEPRDPFAIPVFQNDWSVDGRALAVDGMGLVYVLPNSGSEIQIYSKTGEFLDTWDPTPANEEFWPKYMDVTEGKFIFRASGFPKPSLIVVFNNKREFVCEWFEKYRDDSVAGGTDLLGVGPDGCVYSLLFNEEAVVKYKQNGDFEREWLTHGSSPMGNNWPSGIVVGSGGVVFVSDTLHNRILKFSNDGEYLGEFGEQGQGDGQFSWPTCMARDEDGYLYIVDGGNYRIQKTRHSGEYLGQFEAGEYWWEPQFIVVKGDHVYVLVGNFQRDHFSVLHYKYNE